MLPIRLLVICCIIVIAGVSHAQRAIEPVQKITDFRPVGQLRLWTFIQRDTVIGRLTSTIKDTDTKGDSSAVVIAQTLTLDYTKIGQTLQLTTSGERFLSERGTYLGDELTITINGELGHLNLERKGSEVTGEQLHAGGEEAITRSVGVNQQAFDADFYDQLEIYLALRGMKVGDGFTDTLFSPQIQLPTIVEMRVEEFKPMRIYNQLIESTFVIQMTQPQRGTLLFTPDRRLIKIDIPDLKRKVYLDQVSGAKAELKDTTGAAPQIPKLPEIPLRVRLLATLPHAITYSLFALVAMLLFVTSHIRKGFVWIAALTGIAAFIPLHYLQTPVQGWIVESIFIPQLKAGGSPFFWAVLPAVVVGFMQEIVKFGALSMFTSTRKSRPYVFAVIGAAIGAGFGLVEAIMMTASFGVMPLFTASLSERGFLILFHAAAGALVGRGLSQDRQSAVIALVITTLINSLLRYLPVFAQAKMADVTLLYIIYGLIVLVLVAITWIQSKKPLHSPDKL